MPIAPSATSAAAVSGGRPQPQTTVEPPGGPFIRHSQPSRGQLYNLTNLPFGGVDTQPLVSVPGYLRAFRATISATGGTSTTAVVAAADAPFNCVSLVQVVDPFNTPLITGPGFEVLRLLPLYSGQYGLLGAADVANMPSYSPVNLAAAAGGGNFSFSTALPLEFAKGYGCISMANQAILPKVNFSLATSGVVYTTPPTTPPALNVVLDADYYALPPAVNITPPALGSTLQWTYQQTNPQVSANTSSAVAVPKLGGYVSTVVLIMRDSTGARTDAFWPTGRIRVNIDGVPWISSTMSEIYDDMYNVFGGVARPTGVIALTRKNSMSQLSLGLMDDGETLLSTTPGTLLSIEGSPWGAGNGNGPAQLNILAGILVPNGMLVQPFPVTQ